MDMVHTVVLPKEVIVLHAQGINMVSEICDDEEEEFLRINNSVIPVFDIDVEKILEQYKSKKPVVNSAYSSGSDQHQGEQDNSHECDSEQEQKMHLKQILQAEKAYEKHMSKIARVKEDELQDLNLGSEGDYKKGSF